MNILGEEEPKRRRSETNDTNRAARAAIAEVAARFGAWNRRVAQIRGEMNSSHRRADYADDCVRMLNEVAAARAELLERLMDAPPKVCGHSRVVDLEKALDAIEGFLREIQSRRRHDA